MVRMGILNFLVLDHFFNRVTLVITLYKFQVYSIILLLLCTLQCAHTKKILASIHHHMIDHLYAFYPPLHPFLSGNHYSRLFLSCLIFFGNTVWCVESQFPNQGSIPLPLHWKHGVLTTGLPGKVPLLLYSKCLQVWFCLFTYFVLVFVFYIPYTSEII